MHRAEIQERLEGMLVELFEVDPRDVRRGAFLRALVGLELTDAGDGEALVELIEEHFEISFGAWHLGGVDTVDDLVDLICHEWRRTHAEHGVGGL